MKNNNHKPRLNEDDESDVMLFVLNTKELRDDDFNGSFNDFVSDIEETGAHVTGTYDEDGNPIMTIYDTDADTVEDILSKYGIENPDDFTQEMPDDDDDDDSMDFDKPEGADDDDVDPDEGDSDPDSDPDDEGDGDGDEGDEGDEGDGDDPDEGDSDPDSDDSDSDPDSDPDEEGDEGDDGDVDSDPDATEDEGDDPDIENPDDDSVNADDVYDEYNLHESHVHIPKGTKGLSKSVIKDAVSQVKQRALLERVSNKFFQKYELTIFKDRKKQYLNEQAKAKALEEAKKAASMPKKKTYQDILCENTPYAKVKVNGHRLYEYDADNLDHLLAESKENFRKYRKIYQSTISDTKKMKLKKGLIKQVKLIKILESQKVAFKKFLETSINEDEQIDGQSQDNGGNASGTADRTASLQALVFTVKDADDFIKTLTDNGIPENVLEKVDDDGSDGSDDSSTGDQNAPQTATDAGAGAPPAGAPAPAPAGAPAPEAGGNPFESFNSKLKKKYALNESMGNPFDDAAGAPAPSAPTPDAQPAPAPDDNVEPTKEDDEEGQKVRLTDTSYAQKVKDILANVYKYSKDEFDNKIGGTILDDKDQSKDENSDDGSDEEKTFGADDDEDKLGTEDEINPEDVFGDI